MTIFKEEKHVDQDAFFAYINPLWTELHDLEGRVSRIEESRLHAESIKEGEATANKKWEHRGHMILAIVSGFIGFISGVIGDASHFIHI